MKNKRHEKILELIERNEISTQEELASKLKEAGFQVTQATVSRDIRDLKLTKIAGANGKNRYMVIRNDEDMRMGKKYISVLRDSFVQMDIAQNLLVIHTVSGMAMAVGAAVDAIHFPEVVGDIAGDDTLVCITHTQEEAYRLKERLEKLVQG